MFISFSFCGRFINEYESHQINKSQQQQVFDVVSFRSVNTSRDDNDAGCRLPFLFSG